MGKSEFDDFVVEDVQNQKGISMPVRCGLLERLLTKRIRMNKLHPNPNDEFTFPDIGPNYQIISKYVEDIKIAQFKKLKPFDDDPIIVEKLHPHGYLIVNGHHRWAAAVRLGLKKIRAKIINLAQESDIRKILEKSKHDKRVTLDLDEVVFGTSDDIPREKALKFPYSLKYKQRIRLGIPALFYFLAQNGYDIWVYSSNYYSIDDIKDFFRCYHANVNGIITGMAKKNRQTEASAAGMEKLISNKYSVTLHIDNETILRTVKADKSFDEFEINATPEEWAKRAITIIEEIEKNEQEKT